MRNKILFCVITLLFTSALCGAQNLSLSDKKELKKFSVLKTETRLNVFFDYSQAIINGYVLKDILEVEENFTEGEEDARARFRKEFNDGYKNFPKILIGDYPEAKYTLVFHIMEINRLGGVSAYADLTDSEGNVIAQVSEMFYRGGRYGSFLNLMGDGYQHMGKWFSGWLSSYVK